VLIYVGKDMKRETKKKTGEWLMDVSKYMITAVLISSFFKDLENKLTVYIVSSVCFALLLTAGMVMFDKNSKIQ